MNLTDEQLRILVASGDPSAARELRFRTRRKLLLRLPNPIGTCEAGLRVYLDQKGAYSSGYTIHTKDHSTCSHKVTWDGDTPQAASIKRLIGQLSDLDKAAGSR